MPPQYRGNPARAIMIAFFSGNFPFDYEIAYKAGSARAAENLVRDFRCLEGDYSSKTANFLL